MNKRKQCTMIQWNNSNCLRRQFSHDTDLTWSCCSAHLTSLCCNNNSISQFYFSADMFRHKALIGSLHFYRIQIRYLCRSNEYTLTFYDTHMIICVKLSKLHIHVLNTDCISKIFVTLRNHWTRVWMNSSCFQIS